MLEWVAFHRIAKSWPPPAVLGGKVRGERLQVDHAWECWWRVSHEINELECEQVLARHVFDLPFVVHHDGHVIGTAKLPLHENAQRLSWGG